MTLEDLNNKLNNILIDLNEQNRMLEDLLRILGLDSNEFQRSYSDNYSTNQEKQLSNYRL